MIHALFIAVAYAAVGVGVVLISSVPGVLVALETGERPIIPSKVWVIIGLAWPFFLAFWIFNSRRTA